MTIHEAITKASRTCPCGRRYLEDGGELVDLGMWGDTGTLGVRATRHQFVCDGCMGQYDERELRAHRLELARALLAA